MLKPHILLVVITILFLASCKKKNPTIEDEPAGIIENKTFNSTLLIDGHDYDGTIIRNCIFEDIEGDGLQIRDVVGLCIENCTFRNTSGDAIRFRNSGSSNNVKIINNSIYNIEENGILAPEDHTNTTIKGNLIYNVATNNQSALAGAPHHGIYFQGINVTITENTIYDVINSQGNCVSIRTNGVVSKNRLYGATDHGISYFSDHPGNDNTLLIENNFIYDNGKRGINLASNGNNTNHIGNANIRCNTIISNNESPISMNDDLDDVNFILTGNILIRTDGGSTFVFTNHSFTEENNVAGSGDLGFVNFDGRNLNLISSSAAVNSVTSSNTPSVDYYGSTRTNTVDAGAHELE